MIYFKDFDLNLIEVKPYYSKRSKSWCDNNIYTFDIETTSMWLFDGKWDVWRSGFDYKKRPAAALCYIWQFGINRDYVVYGRTLEDFKQFLQSLKDRVDEDITVWVHNLSFECQFLRNIFDFKVFAKELRQPMYMDIVDIEGVKFRDSLVLTQLSLARCSELFAPDSERKKVGSLDYNKLRTPKSKLSKRELDYCEFDCIALYWTVKHYLDQYSTISNIPLTHTGLTRRVVIEHYKINDPKYFKVVRDLVPYPAEFKVLQFAFWGGWVGGNPCYSGSVLDYVRGRDYNSSYPYQMLVGLYPISHFKMTKKIKRREGYVYIYRIKALNVRSIGNVHYLPHSKILEHGRGRWDNGKLVECGYIELYLTSVDFDIFERAYTYSDMEYVEIWEAKAAPLNDTFRKLIVEMYKKKTQLKDVEGFEDLYADFKTHINALFGMMCTNFVKPEVVYEGHTWNVKELILGDSLNSLRKKWNNINIYSNGVFVTAYARAALWDLILKLDALGVLVYSDTDSHKFLDRPDTAEAVDLIFKLYNEKVDIELARVARELDIPLDDLYPVDPEGVQHPLGFSEDDGIYRRFIHRGAKKYCYESMSGELHVTVSGLNKKAALKKGSPLKSIFDFEKDLKFSEDYSGRMVSTYIDDQPDVEIDGEVYQYRYGLTLRKTTYNLKDGQEYSNFLEWLQGLARSIK